MLLMKRGGTVAGALAGDQGCSQRVLVDRRACLVQAPHGRVATRDHVLPVPMLGQRIASGRFSTLRTKRVNAAISSRMQLGIPTVRNRPGRTAPGWRR